MSDPEVAPAPVDPVVVAAPPSLEDRAKVCDALASAFHAARDKSNAADAAAAAARAVTQSSHAELKAACADLSAAAQAEDA
jgi:hypothetical protein